jgi:hypothetical protein
MGGTGARLMRLPRLKFTVGGLLFAAAVMAAMLTLSTRPRDKFVCVVIIAAGLLMLFGRLSGAVARSPHEAIRIATAYLIETDAAFRPEKHMVRAYLEFGLPRWMVDFYRVDGTSVVKRVEVTDRGVVRGSTSFREDEEVRSLKRSAPMHLLDRDGTVLNVTVRL